MISIVKSKSKYHSYAFIFPFSLPLLDYCRKLKEKYGWRNFTYFQSAWRFSDLGIAWIVKADFPDLVLDFEMTQLMEQYREDKLKERERTENAVVIKDKKKSDLVIPEMKAEIYDYQKVGVEFFINNNGRALLFDAPGAGKTAQALGYIVHAHINKTLVVCPASVKHSWKSEVKKWTNLKCAIINSKTKEHEATRLFVENDLLIINYDILFKFKSFFAAVNFDLLVGDESTYIKSPTANRTKMIKMIAEKIPKILLLSGTPVLSRPIELFTSLQLVDPYTWVDYHGYATRYCEGHSTVWGWDDRGASNIDELKTRISRYYIRREKDEILPELPPKRFIDRPMELNADWRFKYELAEESFGEYLISVKKKTADEAARSLAAEKLVRLNELRQIASAGKVEMAKELIDEIIDSGEKILVFSCYNRPLKELYEHYGKDKSVVLTGQTDEDLRRIAIEQFQTDPKKKIFFGGMASAGVGITLTAASNVLFLDQSWVPSDHIQAADRVHRPGQTAENVNIYQMMAIDTIDDYIREVLVEKQAIIDQIIDNSAKPITGDEMSVQNAVLEKMEKKLIK